MKPAPRRRNAASRLFHNWILPLLVTVAVLTPIRSAIADWNDVPSGSMEPTILIGDRITVNKLAFGLRVPFTHSWIARWDAPEPGEIVTCASPEDGARLVKRVIAVPGDTVAMISNRLVLNGAPVALAPTGRSMSYIEEVGRHFDLLHFDETIGASTHAITVAPAITRSASFPEFTVPEGHIVVMGDNRSFSKDSRAFGLVPISEVYGCATHVAISVDPGNSYIPRLGRFFTKLN